MASAFIILVYSCLIAVCAAFTHTVDNITTSYTVPKTTVPPTLRNTTVPPTSTGPCTETTTEYYMPSYSQIVETITETAVLTILMHVTPYPNGTTATRYETVRDKAMTASDEVMIAFPTDESTTDELTATASTTEDQYRVSNSTTTYPTYSIPYPTNTKPYPVPGLTTKSCSFTSTSVITLHPYIPPTSEIVTATAITVSTLFDYNYLTPHTPIVDPTPTAKPNPGLDSPPTPSKTPPVTTKDSPAQPGPSHVQPPNPPAQPQESPKGPPEVKPVDPTLSKVGVKPPITGVPRPQPTNDATPPPVVTLPGAGPIVIDPSRSEIVISGTTTRFSPGQQTTINDVPISLDSSAGFVVVGSTKTIGLPPPMTPAPIVAPVVIGGTTVDIDDIVPGLQPGQMTTIGTNTISLDESSSFLVVDGTRSIPLNQETSIPSTSTLDVNGVPIPVGQLATELDVGEATVIGSITVSRDDTGLVVGTTTIPVPTKTDEIVVGGTTISPDALPSGFSFIPAASGGGLLLPNGDTLLPGGETTIDGMEISLLPGETPVAVIEDSISITATETAESTTATSSSCSGLTCGQPTRTLTSPTGDNTAASSADVLVSGKWSDFVFASMFVGVFIHWA